MTTAARRRQHDLVIVGGGFAGLMCARSAALRGLGVLVLEKSPQPGHAIRTTGILVKEVAERWEVPTRLTRRIRGVRLYAPALSSFDLAAPGYYFLATDTPALMAWFAAEARRAGATIWFGRPYRGARRDGRGIELAEYGVHTRYLVGADGAASAVARDFGLSRNRAFLLGVEGEYTGVGGVDPDRLHCFVDSKLAPGYIGWVVPGVGGVCQVGLAARRPRTPDLEAFERRIQPLFDWSGASRTSRRGGLIPVGGRVARFGAERVLLVGDAAGIVSPLTAGGIHTALESGWRAAHAIADYLDGSRIDPVRAVARHYPRFIAKRALRWLADLPLPNWLFDAALGTAPMRVIASAVYFHRRGASVDAPEIAPAGEDISRSAE